MKSYGPIRWAVLGTGWVAQRFMADLQDINHAELVAVCSRSGERARTIARSFGASRSYDNYASLLADSDIDVVYIASEHHEHAEHCVRALEGGKHVLCEKPFTITSKEATAVIDAARARRLFCMEAMWSRFLPGALEMRRLIDSGVLGTPRLLTTDFGIPTGDAPGNRFFDPAKGGGALLDRGVYGISLAVALFGAPGEICVRSHRHDSGVDITSSVVIEFAEAKMATISASLGVYSSNEAVVAGSLGRLRVHEPFWKPERITVHRAPAAGKPRSDLNPRSPKERVRQILSRAKSYLPPGIYQSSAYRYPATGYGYGYEAAEVCRCLREGLLESPIMPLDESRIVVATMERIRDASR